ncbi:hypothetical protein [Paractinoplanes brasiliensis]|nr:hypothetical protein [Actinoplanes brasiliensis]
MLADGDAATYQVLVETTERDRFGRGRDDRRSNCTAHCG